MEDSQINGKRVPGIGREVDISTDTSGKTIKSDNLPVLRDNRRDGSHQDLIRDYRLETTAVERDEFHQHKKPKGKAKFIGQSKAEKEMAIRLINAIKSKASPAGLQSLDTLECRICRPPRCFTAPTTLMSHYRSHAGIKPYECRLCRAAFTRQHSLNYHMLIHSNQTRFTCLDCGRKFRHPSHFKEHRRRHTGESPFECSDCLLRFKTRNTYKRHLKTRHGKVLTTSGGLIILSEEEFKRVRTLPRSPPSSQANRADSSKMDVESEEELEDEYYSMSGGDDTSNHSEAITIKEEDICIKTEMDSEIIEEVVSTHEEDRVMNLEDLVREVMKKNGDEYVQNTSTEVDVEWEVETVADSQHYASTVVQIGGDSEGIQLYPVTVINRKGANRSDEPQAKVKVTSALPISPILAAERDEALAVNGSPKPETSSLASLLTGQKQPAAISQSLALLQSRYLVGGPPGMNLPTASEAEQATVLLLANQRLIGRPAGTGAVAVANPAPSDTVSLMLA